MNRRTMLGRLMAVAGGILGAISLRSAKSPPGSVTQDLPGRRYSRVHVYFKKPILTKFGGPVEISLAEGSLIEDWGSTSEWRP